MSSTYPLDLTSKSFCECFTGLDDITDRNRVGAMKFIKPQEFHPIQYTNNFGVAMHILLRHFRNTLVPLKPGRQAMDKQSRYSTDNQHPTSPFAEPYCAKPLHPKTNTVEEETIFSLSQDDSSYCHFAIDEEDNSMSSQTSNPSGTYTHGCAAPLVVYVTQKHIADYVEYCLKRIAEEVGSDPRRITKITGR